MLSECDLIALERCLDTAYRICARLNARSLRHDLFCESDFEFCEHLLIHVYK